MTVLGLSIYPYAHSGYYFDDIYNSELKGTLVALHENLFDFLRNILNMWVVQDGRLYPVGLVTNYTFWIFSDKIAIDRILQIILVLSDIILFGALVRKMSKSLDIGMMAVFFIPILLQVSNLFDGVTSFGGLYQVIPLFMLISLYSLVKYVSGEKYALFWLVIATISEFSALLSYEISVCLVPGMVAVNFFLAKDRARRLMGLAATFLTFFLYLVLYFWFFIHKTAGYDGSEFWLSKLTLKTFLAQFVSAFPFALIEIKITDWSLVGLLFFVFFFCALIFFGSIDGKRTSRADNAGVRALLFLSFSLTFLPPLIISVSKKYEHLVTFGNSYSVVFIQIFGTALFFALLSSNASRLSFLLGIAQKHKQAVLVFISLIYSALATVTVVSNYERILSYNKAWEVSQRREMEQLLSLGFLDEVSSGDSVVLIKDPYIWESGFLPPFGKEKKEVCEAFLSLYARRHINCVTVEAIAKKENILPHVLPGHLYVLERDVRGGNIVQAILFSEKSRTIAVRHIDGKKSHYTFSHERGHFIVPALGG